MEKWGAAWYNFYENPSRTMAPVPKCFVAGEGTIGYNKGTKALLITFYGGFTYVYRFYY